MTNPITITIQGRDNGDSDAPSVDDLLAQIQDIVLLLRDVEAAISGGTQSDIIWRVTDAHMNSPLAIEVSPFPREHAMNIDAKAAHVVDSTYRGILQLATIGTRPRFFSDKSIDRAECIVRRVAGGLIATDVDFSRYEGSSRLAINKVVVMDYVRNLEKLKTSPAQLHRELGSIEGYIYRVEIDGYDRPVVWIKSRVDEQVVKCISTETGLDKIGHLELAEVLRGLRVRVYGLIHYKNAEQISYIDVEQVQTFSDNSELPDELDIVSPNFTMGIEAVKYLEALRNDA